MLWPTVLGRVGSFLDRPSLMAASLVSRQWSLVFRGDHVWATRFRTLFPEVAVALDSSRRVAQDYPSHINWQLRTADRMRGVVALGDGAAALPVNMSATNIDQATASYRWVAGWLLLARTLCRCRIRLFTFHVPRFTGIAHGMTESPGRTCHLDAGHHHPRQRLPAPRMRALHTSRCQTKEGLTRTRTTVVLVVGNGVCSGADSGENGHSAAVTR